jgi:hypothetical protein
MQTKGMGYIKDEYLNAIYIYSLGESTIVYYIATRHYCFLRANVFIGQETKIIKNLKKDEVFLNMSKMCPFLGVFPRLVSYNG